METKQTATEIADLLTESIDIVHDANRHGYVNAQTALDRLLPRLSAALERVRTLGER